MTVSPLPIEQHCRQYLVDNMLEDAAHDMAHVERVVSAARKLAQQESADLSIILPAAWLHDCINLPKNHPDRARASTYSAEHAIHFLDQHGYTAKQLSEIHHAIAAHSYSAGIAPRTLEAKIIQDADRLDALGAIGTIRCLQVGQLLARPLYHSEDPFCQGRFPDDNAYTLDHFYTKLLKLSRTMNTQAGKLEAERRSQFMLQFLTQLSQEI
ncbi:HD domain-containing protein [Thaumasiovibrio sp. DFM-14]|uniref:HD domain-containing protein n=1 Tax=Thaumasiovibrio sp. DFM-14 TaxID=3384792 RepID=UPI0039A0AF4C